MGAMPQQMSETPNLSPQLPPFRWSEVEEVILYFAADETKRTDIAAHLKAVRAMQDPTDRSLLFAIFCLAIAAATPGSSLPATSGAGSMN